MVPPDVDSAAERLVKAREKPADIRNECEWAWERQNEKIPNHINATQPKPDKKLAVNITDSNQRAVVPPSRRRQVLTESTDSHIATRRVQRKKRLNNSGSRKRKKRS